MTRVKCECGGYICAYVNFSDLAECCDCYKPYRLENKVFKAISKNEFSIEFRKRLIEQQKYNK